MTSTNDDLEKNLSEIAFIFLFVPYNYGPTPLYDTRDMYFDMAS